MGPQQSARDRQAQSGALLHIGNVMPSLPECLEDTLQVFWPDSAPGVSDDKLDRIAREFNGGAHGTAGRRELHGIGHEVQRDLPQRRRIRIEDEATGNLIDQKHALLFRFQADDAKGVIDRFMQVNLVLVQFELARLDLREVQDGVDEREQVGTARMDVCRIGAVVRTPVGAEEFILDDLRKAQDGVHRGPEFMAHSGEELALDLV